MAGDGEEGGKDVDRLKRCRILYPLSFSDSANPDANIGDWSGNSDRELSRAGRVHTFRGPQRRRRYFAKFIPAPGPIHVPDLTLHRYRRTCVL